MTLKNEIDSLTTEFNNSIKSISPNDIDSLNKIKHTYLSRKGKLSELGNFVDTIVLKLRENQS